MIALVPPGLGFVDQAHLAHGRVTGNNGNWFGNRRQVLQRFVHVLPVLHMLVELAGFADRRLSGRLVAAVRQWRLRRVIGSDSSPR